MPFTFFPPTVDDVAQVPAGRDPMYRWHPLAIRLRRYYGPNTRGRSVLRIDGAYQTLDWPTQDQIAAATEVYMGGHIYDVDADTAERLRAAGYSIVAVPLVTEAGDILTTEGGVALFTEGVAAP